MTGTNKYKATMTLALVTVGFAASYPFSDTFAGALAASGCSAAMVGGLADWFAVSALFRKPLGIPYRTAIIPRNRVRITQAITDMVEQELLTRENIKETLAHYDFAALIIRYLEDYDGKEYLKDLLNKISEDVLARLNAAKIGAYVATLIQDNVAEIKVARPLAQLLEWSVKQGYLDRLAEFVIDELIILVGQPQVRTLLAAFMTEARLIYEKDMRRRQVASQVLERFGFGMTSMADLAQQQAAAFLTELKDPNNDVRCLLREKILALTARLRDDEVFQNRFETWKNGFIAGQTGLAPRLEELARATISTVRGEAGAVMRERWLGAFVDRLVAGLRLDTDQQEKLAGFVREALSALIDAHHAQIGAIVRARLEQYSTEDLVDFIETRVGNDLQMIRINGSVVGGMAGILLFLLTYWW